MKAISLMAAGLLAASACAAAADREQERPGFGMVEAVTPMQPKSERSAAAGSSAAQRSSSSEQTPRYVLRVRMHDGSTQTREVKRRFAVGDRVLLTNAGDVLPD